jgi:hypothetical protein
MELGLRGTQGWGGPRTWGGPAVVGVCKRLRPFCSSCCLLYNGCYYQTQFFVCPAVSPLDVKLLESRGYAFAFVLSQDLGWGCGLRMFVE